MGKARFGGDMFVLPLFFGFYPTIFFPEQYAAE